MAEPTSTHGAGREPPAPTTALPEPGVAVSAKVNPLWWRAVKWVSVGGGLLILVALLFFGSGSLREEEPATQAAQTAAPTQARAPVLQLTTTPQPISFGDAEITVLVGTDTSMEICFYPLPDEGKGYTFRHSDGSVWARGQGKPTPTAHLQAPSGERRDIIGKLAPKGAC